MSAVRNVLVVGGGAAGASAAVLLADAGVRVDLVEIRPDITALGSGITLQGNALRVLKAVGVLPAVLAGGYTQHKIVLRAPDVDAAVLAAIDVPRYGGDDLPAVAGIYRPTLARILFERMVDAAVTVRTDLTFADLRQDDDGVDVRFTDDSTGRYDLVIGADGVHSSVASCIGIDVDVQPVGLSAWRAVVPRPASVTAMELTYQGRCFLAGFSPISRDEMYAFFVERTRTRPEAITVEAMRVLSEHYHGPWDEIRPSLTESARANYTRWEHSLIDGMWHRGRVVLVGDAAHVCPPTIAQGAAMAFEDAQVLAELLAAADRFDDGLLRRFRERRLPRVKAVIAASMKATTWAVQGEEGATPAIHAQIADIVRVPA